MTHVPTLLIPQQERVCLVIITVLLVFPLLFVLHAQAHFICFLMDLAWEVVLSVAMRKIENVHNVLKTALHVYIEPTFQL